jgi:hypothetical protein
MKPLKAIRKKCIDCSGGSVKEVARCEITDCALHPFRMGKNPNRKGKGNQDNLKKKEHKSDQACQEHTLAEIEKKTPTQEQISDKETHSREESAS